MVRHTPSLTYCSSAVFAHVFISGFRVSLQSVEVQQLLHSWGSESVIVPRLLNACSEKFKKWPSQVVTSSFYALHVFHMVSVFRGCTWFASIHSTPGTPMETTCTCAVTKTCTCCPGSKSSSECLPVSSTRYSASLLCPEAAISILSTANLTCTQRRRICPT